MSLARALTKRMRSQEEVANNNNNLMNRAYSTRKSDKPIDRTKISLPLELISSSNALAYEAPDVTQMQAEFAGQAITTNPIMATITSPSSSASSRKSYEDSVTSPGLSSASSVTSNEMSRESSPIAPSHKPTGFFFDNTETTSTPAPMLPALPVVDVEIVATTTEDDTPDLPKRAPSHTKQNHQSLARQRSLRVSSGSSSTNFAPATRSSIDMFLVKPEADHPFGAELAKVNELAEEFGVKDVQILDEESQYLVDHGFHRFTAEDYMMEIQPLFASAFPVPQTWL